MEKEYIEVDEIIDFAEKHLKKLDDGEAYRQLEYFLEYNVKRVCLSIKRGEKPYEACELEYVTLQHVKDILTAKFEAEQQEIKTFEKNNESIKAIILEIEASGVYSCINKLEMFIRMFEEAEKETAERREDERKDFRKN